MRRNETPGPDAVPFCAQIARKSTIGPWPLQPFWRAIYWALTELPAHLEDVLPPAPTVPLTASKSLPDRSDGGAICASPAGAAANGTAHAAGILVASQGACAAVGDVFAAS